jgi:hypothetical protein
MEINGDGDLSLKFDEFDHLEGLFGVGESV